MGTMTRSNGITFIQTGGTIDKDYPRLTRGYAFEIADPAVLRVLAKVATGFAYNIVTVCRKDSTEILPSDREAMFAAVASSRNRLVIVTHGTDTLIETAVYLGRKMRSQSALRDRVVIVTGAMKPQKFVDSDAAFNIGVAVGASGALLPGAYVAMNGCVRPASTVQRDYKTGQFVAKSKL